MSSTSRCSSKKKYNKIVNYFSLSAFNKYFAKKLGLTAIIGLAISLIFFPILKVSSIHSSFFDLGIFESIIYRIAQTNDFHLSLAAGHIHAFFPIYGWVYSLFPPSLAPYFLVGSQGILLALPAYFLFRRFGLFVSFVYISYYPVWANAFFDFHFDHLVVPLLFIFYLALLDRRIVLAIFSATLLMLVKETLALQTLACGVFLLIVAFRNKSVWDEPVEKSVKYKLLAGSLWLIIFGGGYFIFATHYILPYYGFVDSVGFHGGSAFGWLGSSLTEMLSKIISSPHTIILKILSTPGKLIYFIVAFGLLAFIPFFRPVLLIPALPMMAIAMLSESPEHYNYNSHYMAGLIAPLIMAFTLGLPQAKYFFSKLYKKFIYSIFYTCNKTSRNSSKRQEAIFRSRFYWFLGLFVLVGHILLSPSPISRLFWSDKVWSYSWQAFVPSHRDEMIKAAMKINVPVHSKISVATQNTVNFTHLAHRKLYLPFPLGIDEPYKLIDTSSQNWSDFLRFIKTGYKTKNITIDRYADYVVLDLKRPYFLLDRGCHWLYGECVDKIMETRFLEWVTFTQTRYDKVFENDGFMILRRQ